MQLTSWLDRIFSRVVGGKTTSQQALLRRRSSTFLKISQIETLEDRRLLTVEALTLADPTYWGTTAAGNSGAASSFSSDSQLIAFESDAGNLTSADFNGVNDIFVRDFANSTTILVSATTSGQSGNGPSFNPRISADGNFVAFESDATDLVAGDTNNRRDVFVRNLQTGVTTRVSIGTGGSNSDNAASVQAISGDGRIVLFTTNSTNIVGVPTNGQRNIFARDLVAGTTVLVTLNFNNTAGGNNNSVVFGNATLSRDGRYVAFDSVATDLVTNDLNGVLSDVFVRDLQLQTTTLISVNNAGTGSGSHQSTAPVFDATGRYIAFESRAQDLVPGNVPAHQIYVRDTLTNTTTRVTTENVFDGQDVSRTRAPVFSPDGRYLAYEALLTESLIEVYARDLVNNTTLLVSANKFENHIADGISLGPVFSPDGQSVYFSSTGTNLVEDASNGFSQIYRRNLATNMTSLVSAKIGGSPGDKASDKPILAPDGASLVFQSQSTGLAAVDNNALRDLFVVNTATNAISIASSRSPAIAPEYTSRTVDPRVPTAMSDDGRYVVFTSDATDLVPNPVSGKNVYRHDRVTGLTELVNLNPDGTGGQPGSTVAGAPQISSDGRYVLYDSSVLSPIPGLQFESGLPGGPKALFVRDMQTGTTRAINVNTAGRVAGLTGEPYYLSPNGRYAAFSTNQKLLASDTNLVNDVYVFDLQSDTLVLASATPSGVSGNGFSGILSNSPVGLPRHIFSDDGRYLLFNSRATDLVAAGGATDAVYVRDLHLGTTTLVSVTSEGTVGRGQAESMSADGRRVVFTTQSQLLPSDTNSQFDVYLRDLDASMTTLVTGAEPFGGYAPEISRDGQKVIYTASGLSIKLVQYDVATQNRTTVHSGTDVDYMATQSFDGRYVVFLNNGSNLATGDANDASDVFLFNTTTQEITLASPNQSGTGTGNRGVPVVQPLINANGSVVVYASDSFDLVRNDFNAKRDIFAFTRATGTGALQGEVFLDSDGNGDRNGVEGPLSGWQVFLDANQDGVRQPEETLVLTSGTGQFAFNGLTPGVYHVAAESRTGYSQTAPTSLRFDVTVQGTETISNLDFGFQQQFADLTVNLVGVPLTAVPGGQITVAWTVSALGLQSVAGSWQDAVYLSTDPVLDSDDLLLGTVAHAGGLAAGGMYPGNLTAAVPPLKPGTYYAIVRADRRSQVPQADRSNDLKASTTTVSVDVPSLVIDTPLSGALTAAGEFQYFKLTPPADRSLSILLDSLANSGAVAIYVKRGELPTPGSFDFRTQDFTPDATVLIPQTLNSTYYILVEGQFGAAATSEYTLSARLPGFSIAGLEPLEGGNSGRVTVRIDGTELTPQTQAQLNLNGTTRSAVAVDYRDPSHLYATFDLTGVPIGQYDLTLLDGPQSAVAPAAFEVKPGVQNPLTYRLAVPGNYRPGRQTPFIVEVTNTGNTDVVAPLLRITSDSGQVRLAEQDTGGSENPAFLATSDEGPAGIIRPGQTVRITLTFLSNETGGAGNTARFTLDTPDNLNDSIDWSGLKQASQPTFMPDAAWDLIWQRYQNVVGTTIGDYQTYLASAATYLGSLGINTSEAARLASLPLLEANNALIGNDLSNATDLSLPMPGLEMDFGRVNLQTISGRYRLGALGYGWAHEWEVSAAADGDGNVTLELGGVTHFYQRLANGLYEDDHGETHGLTQVNGAYQLHQDDGGLLKFGTNGKFASFEDLLGNRISATYDSAGQLSRLDSSSGDFFVLEYHPATQRLIKVTDSAGRTVDYTYDATGEHLMSVTTARGTTNYTYVSGARADTLHALASIGYPDGTHTFHQFDDLGRLTQVSNDTGANSLTLHYGLFGEVTYEDARGGITVVHLNDIGQVEILRDSLGNTTEYDYDDENLSRATTPDGVSQSFELSHTGGLISTTNGNGDTYQFDYNDHHSNVPVSFEDSRGNTTIFDVDDQGRLLGTHYPDGTREQFGYDAAGNATSVTTRAGDVVQYNYNSRGQVVDINVPGNNDFHYSYDARGNLTAATDVTGTTTLTYDNADRLIRVVYPTGRFMAYGYDSLGRRIRVDQNGFIVNYSYDVVGRISNVTNEEGALLASYEYDAMSNVTRKESGNGTYTTYQYDQSGQLKQVVNFAPDDSINSRFDYTYDDMGRRTSVTTLEGTTQYGYDLVGQLVFVSLPGGRTIRYEYDAAGNRTRVIDNGLEINYAMNSLNEYQSAGEATFTYDANGNLKTRSDSTGVTTYTFDSLNRLSSVFIDRTSGADTTILYVYDALGNRVAQIKDGVRTDFLVDPAVNGSLVGEYDTGGNALANYVFGLGLVGQFDSNSSYYYDFDAQGSTTGLTDTHGDYVNRYSYLPFGETTVQSETVSNVFRFVGQYGVIDRGTGLVQMGQRDYDPTVGQFTSEDPIGLTGGDENLRRYVWNDPVNYVDPLGYKGDGTVPSAAIQAANQASDDLANGRTVRICTPDPEQPGRWTTRTGTYEEFQKMQRMRSIERDFMSRQRALQTLKIPLKRAPLSQTLSRLAGGVCRVAPIVGAAGNVSAVYHLANAIWNRAYESLSFGLLAKDPNDIVGPSGFGSQNFVTPDHSFPYTIRFENDPEQASAPAQEVFVETQLDADLDWATFELGDVGFGSLVIDVTNGLKEYHTQVEYQNQDGSPLLVSVEGQFNVATGLVLWTFRSLDPVSGELPAGVFDGFLPVNDASGRGEGFIQYLVHPKVGLGTGSVIAAKASIVFDINAPILTNEYLNTIDVGAPSSQIAPLPETTLTTTFPVSWSGTDDPAGPVGSGIATYDVYVSDNGGAFVLFRSATTNTFAEFIGQAGHTYGFYSVATDNVGLRQTPPQSAQATTRVVLNTAPVVSGLSTVTYVGREPAVSVFPEIIVTDAEENLAGGTLRVSISDIAFGRKSKRFDLLSTSTLASLGNVTPVSYTGGNAVYQVQLKANVTAGQIETALKGISFSTNGKGLKTATRNLKIELSDGSGASSNVFNQTLQVVKRQPRR